MSRERWSDGTPTSATALPSSGDRNVTLEATGYVAEPTRRCRNPIACLANPSTPVVYRLRSRHQRRRANSRRCFSLSRSSSSRSVGGSTGAGIGGSAGCERTSTTSDRYLARSRSVAPSTSRARHHRRQATRPRMHRRAQAMCAIRLRGVGVLDLISFRAAWKHRAQSSSCSRSSRNRVTSSAYASRMVRMVVPRNCALRAVMRRSRHRSARP